MWYQGICDRLVLRLFVRNNNKSEQLKQTQNPNTVWCFTLSCKICCEIFCHVLSKIVLSLRDSTHLLCFVSTTRNLHACLYVYASGMDKFSHPTLALPPCNGAVPYLSKFWLLTKPSVPNSKSNFVEARASQCLQLVCTHRNRPAARPIRNPDNPRLVCKPV